MEEDIVKIDGIDFTFTSTIGNSNNSNLESSYFTPFNYYAPYATIASVINNEPYEKALNKFETGEYKVTN